MIDDSEFTDLRTQIFELHPQGKWQEALNLIEQTGTECENPADSARVIGWKACLQCLLEHTEEAVRTFEEGLDKGYWWSERWLRNDTDLIALQGTPEFESVIAKSERCCQQEEMAVKTARLVKEPSSGKPPYPLILALHGYNGNVRYDLPFWSPLTEHGWLVASLQSSQLSGMDAYHWTDEDRAKQDVQHHLEELSDDYSVDEDRLVIGGFSNGGRTALMLALTGAIPAQQVISVCSSLRDETLENLDWETIRASNHPRILFLIGEHDQKVLIQVMPQAETLRTNGLDVEVQIVPNLGHNIPNDLASRVLAWLA